MTVESDEKILADSTASASDAAPAGSSSAATSLTGPPSATTLAAPEPGVAAALAAAAAPAAPGPLDTAHVREAAGEPARLFWALVPPLATAQALTDATQALAPRAKDLSVRAVWVPGAQLHVTLKFMGWQRRTALAAMRHAAARVVAAFEPFEVAVRGAGGFPGDTGARVLWAGVDDPSGQLAALAAGLDKAMAELGVPTETRPFHPHVTLARVRQGEASSLIATLGDRVFGPCSVSTLVLYEARPRSKGSEYTVLARLRLGQAHAERMISADCQTDPLQRGTASEEPQDGQPESTA